MTELLRMQGIDKRFPGVYALKRVNFDVRAGEVHALVGENGAGKSTLMHILAGVHQPDAGLIELSGKGVRITNEHVAQQLGIAMVFQERSLFDALSIAENIFSGRQPATLWGHVRVKELLAETAKLLDEVRLKLHPLTPVADLSPAQQQMVEIAKALSLHAKLFIFDEPTAALTQHETDSLFAIIKTLQARGAGVIYISHRLEEIFRIADRVTVLKDGSYQGTFAVSETTPYELVGKMVGREISSRKIEKCSRGRVVLEVNNLSGEALSAGSGTVVRNASFSAHAGEVLAFAGLAGAGRTELALSIFGARPRRSGEVRVDGKPVQINSPADAIAAGIGYLPEDRKEEGLFLEMSIARNIAAANLQKFGHWRFRDDEQGQVADEFRQKLRIASFDSEQIVQTLSGGNQQKVVLAKWLLVNPKVLIVDEPTRGVDVGAKAEVHELLLQLSRSGTAVIVISSELPEVLALADRILVMREGRIAGELSREEATEDGIMRYASMTVQE